MAKTMASPWPKQNSHYQHKDFNQCLAGILVIKNIGHALFYCEKIPVTLGHASNSKLRMVNHQMNHCLLIPNLYSI